MIEGKGRKADLDIGSRWARVRVTDIQEEFRQVDEFESRRDLKIEMECDCGKKFQIWASGWKGRKYVQDCGCGIAAMDRVWVVKAVSMPSALWMELQGWISKQPGMNNRKSTSKAVCDFIREGLERRKEEENKS